MSDTLVNSLLMAGKENKKTLASMDETLKAILKFDQDEAKKNDRARKEDKQDRQRKSADNKITDELKKLREEAKKNNKKDKDDKGGGLGGALGALTTALGALTGGGLQASIAQAVRNALNKPGSTTPKGSTKPGATKPTKPPKPGTTRPNKPGATKPTKPSANKPATVKPPKPKGPPKVQAPKGKAPAPTPTTPTVKPPASSLGSKAAGLGKGLVKGGATLGLGLLGDYLINSAMSAMEQEMVKGKLTEYVGMTPEEKKAYKKKLEDRKAIEKDYIEGKSNAALYWLDKSTAMGGETVSEKTYRNLDNLLNGIEYIDSQSKGVTPNTPTPTPAAPASPTTSTSSSTTTTTTQPGQSKVSIEIGGKEVDPKDYAKHGITVNTQKRQTGGPITVPGSGSGDKVPMMLKPGSFVLNRNASDFLRRQTGGEVPTMLEPGELVYLNENIKRFQTGGEVSGGRKDVTRAEHPNTGAGWQPNQANDYKNRPVVLSQAAAASFADMMKAGGVNGGDVTSSQRSAGYNAQIGGAVRSNHLSGTAIDIHGTSKAWLKNGGADRFGWKLLDPRYTSHDGHFDYTGRPGDSKMPVAPAEAVKTKNVGDVRETKEKKVGADEAATGPNATQEMKTGHPVIENLKKWYMFYKTLPGGDKFAEQFAAEADKNPIVKSLGGFLAAIGGVVRGAAGALGVNLGGGNGTIGSSLDTSSLPTESLANMGTGRDGTFGAGTYGSGRPSDGAKGAAGDSAKSSKPYEIASSIGFTKADWDIFRNSVGAIESGNKYDISGGSGGHYDGRWQLGDAAKTDAARYLGEHYPGHGPAARKNFQKDPAMQERYFAAFTAKNHAYLSGHPKYDAMSTREKFEVLGYAHNQGAGGARKWLDTGVVGQDGFGTKADKYAKELRKAYQAAGPQQKKMGGAVMQSGGMVPTMLEPGEMVFGPGQWDKGIEGLNSDIPRFQTGGMVGVNGRNRINQMLEDYTMKERKDQAQATVAPSVLPIATEPVGNAGPGDVPQVPELPSGPSVAFLSDVINRTSLGGVFN